MNTLVTKSSMTNLGLKIVTTSLAISLFWAIFAFNSANAASRGISLETINKPASIKNDSATYRALIIGNNDYQDSLKTWPPLATAVADAKAVANILKANYGFEDVTLLENATRRDILHSLNELTKRVGDNDSVLLYYAGHGYLDNDTMKGYWIPIDAVGRDHTTFLRNSTIRDELNTIASRAKHTLLISDSCFSGSLLRGVTRGPAPDTDQDRYYQKVAEKKSVQIITAGGVEFVDDNYSNSGHSPFTYFLLNELNHNDKPVITASELSSNVEKAVANNTNQVPESGVLQGAGDELGEFIFLRIDVHVEGVPKDKVKVNVNVTPVNKAVEESQQEETLDPTPKKKESFNFPLPTM